MSGVRVAHQFIGQVRVYMPLGFSPWDPAIRHEDRGSGVLLIGVGDACVIESAWINESSGRTILNVRSLETGLNAQTIAEDFPIRVRVVNSRMCPPAPHQTDRLFDGFPRCEYCGGRESQHRTIRL